MCGIFDLWEPERARSEAEVRRLSAGCWVDQEAGLPLGHRRLAIVDLSVEGNQPMVSATGYGRYFMAEKIARQVDWMPQTVRRAVRTSSIDA